MLFALVQYDNLIPDGRIRGMMSTFYRRLEAANRQNNFTLDVNVNLVPIIDSGMITGHAGLHLGDTNAGSSSGMINLPGGVVVPAHATGGILSTPHLGLIAEAGPEAIIPLSSQYRSRGLSLWQQAGEMLGVYSKSGGSQLISTGGVVPEMASGDSSSTSVTIGDVNVEVRVDGAGDPKDVARTIGDDIAQNIVIQLERSFANLPLAAKA